MKKLMIFLGIICALIVGDLFIFNINVHADEGEVQVVFGSDYYNSNVNDEFNIGVYITAEEILSDYDVTIKYDNDLLEYVSGATTSENGILHITGMSDTNEVMQMLTFRALNETVTKIEIIGAAVYNEEATLNLSSYSNAPIFILNNVEGLGLTKFIVEQGEISDFSSSNYIYSMDVGAEAKEVSLMLESTENSEIEITDTDLNFGRNIITILLTGEDESETKYYLIVNRENPYLLFKTNNTFLLGKEEWFILNSKEQIPFDIEWEYKVKDLQVNDETIAFITNEAESIKCAYAVNTSGNIELFAYNESAQNYYLIEKVQNQESNFYLTSLSAANSYPEEITEAELREAEAYFGIDSDGNTGFFIKQANGEIVEYQKKSVWESDIFKYIVIMVLIIIMILLIIKIIINRRRKINRKRQLRKLIEEQKESTTEDSNDERIPVIKIQNVTMKFRLSTENVSSLKEYLIKRLKGKPKYRDFYALKNISLNVYDGEVVGVIGTNGSGKSTLLKILSGALKPTSGKVKVNHNKVQLLSLGTGFDLELTARENIYLNGAIIGYSKNFIDEKFDEIVEFAELEGFMDEKVKNFSSGMVSRLGFAIATIRDTPEILILDEVLSVGDMFFKKKSEERIGEMIHGGSTVLIVSHSADVITKNCTRAIWIEKGNLRMMGNPKEVCEAYKKMNESV